MKADRFCEECGVSKALHYGEDDCEQAEQRAQLVENFPLRNGYEVAS